MEISNNLILSEEQLNKGEVECFNCHKGKYKPLNPRYEKNHCFICNCCGDKLTVEPNVVID